MSGDELHESFTVACPDCRLVGRDCACMPGEGEEPEDNYDHDPYGETQL